MRVLYQGSGVHRRLTVYDTAELLGEKGRFRVLEFSNEAIQGAIDLDRPERILFEYPRAIIHLMEVNRPSFEQVFVIGHGIGTIAAQFPAKRFTVAELDGRVAELSRKYFGYTLDNVVIGDGRQILESQPADSFEFILLDGFTEQGTPRHLLSGEFFRIVRDKLDSRGGAVIVNLMGKGEGDRLINAVHATLREQFAYAKAFALPAEGRRSMQNVLLVGGHAPIRFQERRMAGFREIELEPGYLIRDED